jgi:hypothetical protein
MACERSQTDPELLKNLALVGALPGGAGEESPGYERCFRRASFESKRSEVNSVL